MFISLACYFKARLKFPADSGHVSCINGTLSCSRFDCLLVADLSALVVFFVGYILWPFKKDEPPLNILFGNVMVS